MLSKVLDKQIEDIGSFIDINLSQRDKIKSFLSELLSDGLPPPKISAKDGRMVAKWNDLGVGIDFRYHGWLDIYAHDWLEIYTTANNYQPEIGSLNRSWKYKEVLEIKKYMTELYAKTI